MSLEGKTDFIILSKIKRDIKKIELGIEEDLFYSLNLLQEVMGNILKKTSV